MKGLSSALVEKKRWMAVNVQLAVPYCHAWVHVVDLNESYNFFYIKSIII
jgi:hypothetical protein